MIRVPPYPRHTVVGPCVCGSWPGGKCLKCPLIVPTAEQLVGRSPIVMRDFDDMTDSEKRQAIRDAVNKHGGVGAVYRAAGVELTPWQAFRAEVMLLPIPVQLAGVAILAIVALVLAG